MGPARSAHGRVRGRLTIREATPWVFPCLYLGWAYLFWVPIVISGESVWSFPNVILLGIGGLSPLLAGLGLLWLTVGPPGFRDLRRRLTEPGRISPPWWVTIVLFYPVFTGAVAGVAIATGAVTSPLEPITTGRLFDPGAVVLLVVLALLAPAIEEIGLRGYWFDRLQARWSALVSSLILGVVWAAWHVPLVYMVGYFERTTFDPELWWWLPSIVLTAIVGTWVYNNTHRSVLAVIALHFVGNLTGEMMGFVPELYPYVHLGTVLVVIVLVVGWGPTSLRGRGRSRPVAPMDGSSP